MRLITLALTALLAAAVPAHAAPAFAVDASWPAIPNGWQFGWVASVAVDAQDHVWVLQRPGSLPAADKPHAAPPVLEFANDGTFMQAWGGAGRGYDWPESEHGIFVDQKGFVWIGGNGAKDHQILKFTRDGKFVMQIGHAGKSSGNADTGNLNRPADVFVYPQTNELFVADGYGNRRIIVFDAGTGRFKRMWGAFGNTASDAAPNPADADADPKGAPQFVQPVHAARVSNDGLVYVSDRGGKRVQVFTLAGKYVSQVFIGRDCRAPGCGNGQTAAATAFSPDRAQQYLYVANASQAKVMILERKTLKPLGEFGRAGSAPGEFGTLHHLAADSHGNIYTTEVNPREPQNRRVQKFRPVAATASAGPAEAGHYVAFAGHEAAGSAAAGHDEAARAAVVRALPLMQRSAATFVEKRNCISCHHNALAVMMLRLADRRGVHIDPAVLDAVETHTFRELRGATAADDAIQGVTLSDPTPNDSFVLMAAHAASLPPDLTTAVYARRLLRWQRPDGRWITSDFRPPHSSSQFTATATAALALRTYLPNEMTADRDAALRRAIAWLAGTWPHSTEDAAFRVLGLVWAGAPADAITAASRVLLSLQLPEGGWAQLPDYAADAYSTGEALYALAAAGVPTSTREWQRGRRFLLSTQAKDGSWHVRTRMLSPADVSPPYFHTGFPYGKDEFLSYAGSAWAVMALLSGLPETPATIPPAAPGAAPAPPSWLRTALFGPASELTAALNGGLDPNSRTAAGTTLLMAAALDADKTRALLARGADAGVRGKLGVDALTIASSHVGTSASVQALLDAGAAPQAPEGVRVRRSPIVAASMAGDVNTVKLLLARGAKPSGEAVSEAVTFGHADAVSALLAAGGDATGVDRTGINLLHWAAITNRASVIPILVKAGVSIDAIDDAGFTPLMYAVTIDQGDEDTLEALLRAGASQRIRNDEGRTPAQQAERLKHKRAALALRDR